MGGVKIIIVVMSSQGILIEYSPGIIIKVVDGKLL